MRRKLHNEKEEFDKNIFREFYEFKSKKETLESQVEELNYRLAICRSQPGESLPADKTPNAVFKSAEEVRQRCANPENLYGEEWIDLRWPVDVRAIPAANGKLYIFTEKELDSLYQTTGRNPHTNLKLPLRESLWKRRFSTE